MATNPAGLILRGQTWHIRTTVKVSTKSRRIQETTGCQKEDLATAKSILERRKLEVTKELLDGPKHKERTFAEAAVEYVLSLERRGKSTKPAEYHLNALDPVIGGLPLSHVHQGTLNPWIEAQYGQIKSGTVERTLHTVSAVLNYAARVLRDGNKPWLITQPPKIVAPDWNDQTVPYQLSWDEQDKLVSYLADHLIPPVQFGLATGAREAEITSLRWDQACEVTGLPKYSVWWIPPAIRKGSARKASKDQEGRYLICNQMARSVITGQEGNGSEVVFPGPKGKAVVRFNNKGFRNARKKAGIPCRFHDLRHTFGERLSAAGVPWDYRKALLGHVIGDVTARYSAPGLALMLEEAEKIRRDGVTILHVAGGRYA